MIESKLPAVGTTIFTVMSRLAEEHGAVNLGQGFPDFDPPESLKLALARHVASGKNQYAPMAGVPALRERIAVELERSYGRRVDPDRELTITSGATEAIFDAIAAVVRPGDEVIVLDPAYDSYEPAVLLQGGRAVHVPLHAPSFSVDWQRVADALTARTRLIVVNFPHNPSGAVLAPEELDTLAELLRGTNVLVLSDEVYEHIVFDGRKHQSVLRHDELYERSFAVSSFGKSYHATGWKLGWAAAPPALTSELRKVHQFVTFSTSTAAQHALADVLAEEPAHLDALGAFYQAKRDRFRELVAGVPLTLLPVAGAYFQLADYSAVSREDDMTFARRLTTDLGVAAIPLSPFYAEPPEQRVVRFCFCKRDETLVAAAERLRRLAPTHR
ncbi:MAG TPA: methionine aminotransferase [Polyangiaceae bacterium]|nr:methionine aminotransferase [Polyangiaceae bacterium]